MVFAVARSIVSSTPGRTSDSGSSMCLRRASCSFLRGGNTYKVAISIKDNAGGENGLGLAPLALTASGETKSTTGNTLTVAFES